jgi:hypothetical protein
MHALTMIPPTFSSSSSFFDIVFLPEPLDSTGGIHKFLFSRKERVAGGADFHLYVFRGGSGLDHVPTGAGDLGLLVFRMNLLFHYNSITPGFNQYRRYRYS